MKKTIKNMLVAISMIPMIALGVSVVSPAVHAADCNNVDSQGAAGGADCSKSTTQPTNLFGSGSIFQVITNTALFVIGAVSVIMLIYGGIRYTISGGDSNAVTAAKNTILYAIVGLIVAVMAYAIVNFVLVNLSNAS